MAISYTLVPIPIWYLVDNFGRPLGGGKLFTYRSLDKVEFKPVFQDPGGLEAWPNPILFDLNGTSGPFFWQFDTDNPDETYYLEAYDKDNNLVWTVDGYSPGVAGGGGGGTITEVLPLTNSIANNVFWRNIGTSATPIPANTVIAPSSHVGFSTPDIIFFKDANTATDNIAFLPFGQGNDPLTGDVTPEYYLEYTCTNEPTGETMKYIQFPLNLHIKTLENLTFTYSIWARGVSGTQTISLSLLQFTGSGGGASPSVITPISTLITLTNGWVNYSGQFTVPSTAGLVLGGCGDDATYLQVNLPTDDACTIDITKVCWYLGTVNPFMNFQTYDDIEPIIDGFRTGDIRISLNGFSPFGWVPMNDGTIGSASSGATTRANIDTFQLYQTIWNRVSNTFAPVTGGRGGSAAADFVANKAMALTKQLGRDLASIGIPSSGGTATNWALGQTDGQEESTMTISQMPAHNHPGSTVTFTRGNNLAALAPFPLANDIPSGTIGPFALSIASQGGGQPFPTVPPRSHYDIFAKL